jgi:hypothetical protein
MPVRELDEGDPVVGEYALHRQSGVLGKVCVLTASRAIAKGFHTELNDHSRDLLGSIIVNHYVAGRPQCPTCDSKKLRDPRRAPTGDTAREPGVTAET